mgnify:CR=1 FL=1
MPIKHAKLIEYLIDCSNVINNAIFKYQIAVPLYTVFRSVRTFKQNPIFIAAEFEKEIFYFQGSLAASLFAEKIVMARTHSSKKHLSVCLITIGIIMCTFESAKTLENQSSFIDWSIGIVMLSTSLVLSALMGVSQERIFNKWGKHYQEALFFTVTHIMIYALYQVSQQVKIAKCYEKRKNS